MTAQLEKQKENVGQLDLEYVQLSVPKTLALLNKVSVSQLALLESGPLTQESTRQSFRRK